MRPISIVLAAFIAALALASPAFGAASRSWPRPPAWALRAELCLHSHEGGWHEKSNRADRGGLQFSYSTWGAVGGVGDPADASVAEQLWRGYLWRLRYGRWGGRGGWPNTAPLCGLY